MRSSSKLETLSPTMQFIVRYCGVPHAIISCGVFSLEKNG